MFLTHLECTNCRTRHEWETLQNLCTKCQKPLFPRYDLEAVGKKLKKEDLASREKSLWRFREVLPLPMDAEPVTFGEGATPLLRAERFGKAIGLTSLWVKDEAQIRRRVSRRAV
jgi:threonine synthase